MYSPGRFRDALTPPPHSASKTVSSKTASPHSPSPAPLDERFRGALHALTAARKSLSQGSSPIRASSSPASARFDWLLSLDGVATPAPPRPVARAAAAPQSSPPPPPAAGGLVDALMPILQSPSASPVRRSPPAHRLTLASTTALIAAPAKEVGRNPSQQLPSSRDSSVGVPFSRDAALGRVALLEAKLAEQQRAHGDDVRHLQARHALEQRDAAAASRQQLKEVLVRAQREFESERRQRGAHAVAKAALWPLRLALSTWRAQCAHDRRRSAEARSTAPPSSRPAEPAQQHRVHVPTTADAARRSVTFAGAAASDANVAAAVAVGGHSDAALATAVHRARTLERLYSAVRTVRAQARQRHLGRVWRVWRSGAEGVAKVAALRAKFASAAHGLKDRYEQSIEAHTRDKCERILELERAHQRALVQAGARAAAAGSEEALRAEALRRVKQRNSVALLVRRMRKPFLSPAFATWKLNSVPLRIPTRWLRWHSVATGDGSSKAAYAASLIAAVERETNSDVQHWIRSHARRIVYNSPVQAEEEADAPEPECYRIEVADPASHSLGASIGSTMLRGGATAVCLIEVRSGVIREQYPGAKAGDLIVAVNGIGMRSASIEDVVEAIAESETRLVVDFEAPPTLNVVSMMPPPPQHGEALPPPAAASVPPAAATSNYKLGAPAGGPHLVQQQRLSAPTTIAVPASSTAPRLPPTTTVPPTMMPHPAVAENPVAVAPAAAARQQDVGAAAEGDEVVGPLHHHDHEILIADGVRYHATIVRSPGEMLGISVYRTTAGLVAFDKVVDGGAAKNCAPQMCVGDIITAVNGVSMIGQELQFVLTSISSSPQDKPLTMECHSPSLSESLGEGRLYEMILDPAEGEKLGMAICHGESEHHGGHVVIQYVAKGGAAHRAAPHATAGDVIISFNGISCLDTPIDDVTALLQSTPGEPMNLHLFEPKHRLKWEPTSSPDLEEGVTYDMLIDIKEGERLGLSITDSHDHHIQIRHIIPNGAAHRAAPNAKEGDIIVAVNDVPVLSTPLEVVQDSIMQGPRPVKLTLHSEHNATELPPSETPPPDG